MIFLAIKQTRWVALMIQHGKFVGGWVGGGGGLHQLPISSSVGLDQFMLMTLTLSKTACVGQGGS